MKINRYIAVIVSAVILAALLWSCADADPRPLRSDTEIETIYTAKRPSDEGWLGTVDNDANTIVFNIPTIQRDSVDLEHMYVWVTSGPVDAFYSPRLGYMDMTQPWDLTVTGGDGSRRTYKVSYTFHDGVFPVIETIRIAQNEGDAGWVGVVDNDSNTIVFTAPMDQRNVLDLTQMYLWITDGTTGASYSIDSEIVDISSPLKLTVTAPDGIERDYTLSMKFYDGIVPLVTDVYAYSAYNPGPPPFGWAGTVDQDEKTITFNIPTTEYGTFDFSNYWFWVDTQPAPDGNKHGTEGTPTYSPEAAQLDMTKSFDLTVKAEDGTENIYTVLPARYYDGKVANLPYSYVYKDDSGIGWFDTRVNHYERTIMYLINSSYRDEYDLEKVYWFIDRNDTGYNSGTFVPPGVTGYPIFTPEDGWKDFTKPWDFTIEAWDGSKTVYTVIGIEFGDNY